MTFDNVLVAKDDGSLTTNGVAFNAINLDSGSGVRTLLDNVTLGFGPSTSGDLFCETGSTLAMGTKTIAFLIADDAEDGAYLNTGSLLTFSAGAKWTAAPIASLTAPTYFDVELDDGQLAPPIEVTGGLFLYGPAAILATSIAITDGGIYWDTFDHETTGDCTIVDGMFTLDGTTPGGMSGQTLTVGGNLDIDGTAGITNGNLAVTGTATIHNATISNMTSTGDVDCFDNCVDGGGNDAHFLFPDITGATIISVTTDHVDGGVITSATINLDVLFTEAQTVTGTPRLQFELHTGTIPRYVNYSSGSGTDTLRFTMTVLASDSFNALRVVAIDLNGGTIKDAAGNNADLTLPDFDADGGLDANVYTNRATSYATIPQDAKAFILI